MRIPSIIRSIFDAFPLNYHTNDFANDSSSDNAYYFIEKTQAKPLKRASTLAVNNVRRIHLNDQFKKYIPTDPAGLSVCLTLCREFDLNLPCESSNGTSGHCMVPLSYLASPSKELPMVIETDEYSNNSWTGSFQKGRLTTSHNLSSTESILSEYLESLTDLWTLFFLASSEDSTFSKTLFHRDPEIMKNKFLCNQINKISKFDVQSWNHFASRSPHLFSDSAISPRIINDFVSLSGKRIALQKELQNKLDEFKVFIPLFMSHTKEVEKTPITGVFELKFVSIIICIKYFLPANLQFSEIFGKDFQSAVQYSEKVLMTF